MSWFTDIAGRAEDLLNKVDQTAATALQSKSKSRSPFRKQQTETYSSETSYSPSQALPTPSRNPVRSVAAAAKKRPESDDEKLLQFLNSSDSLPPATSGKMQLGASSKPAVGSLEQKEKDKEFVKDENTAQGGKNKLLPDATDSGLPEKFEDEILISEGQQPPFDPTKASNNAKEIVVSKTLPKQELIKAENKTKIVNAGNKMAAKSEAWSPQLTGAEKAFRELQEREKDLSAALSAKDAQLAILKVRLDEADQELEVNRNIVKDLRDENDRIIKEHAQSAAFQNKTTEFLQEQVQKAESDLNKTKESFLQNQKELMQKLGKMEEEHQHLGESYSTLQRKWAELSEKNKEIVIQLKQANGNFQALQQEHEDYKQKAQRILQSKEKLITSLKGGHFEETSSAESAAAALTAEIDGVKQERDLLREEMRRASELAESYRAEVREMEKMAQGEAAAAQESMQLLRGQLEGERQGREDIQLQNSQMKEELQLLREDLARTKNGFQSRIQDREIEVEKLRRQLTAKTLSTVSQDELESRLHALTENLIQKQTLVEALSTEKNSLVLQRERLEQQLREAQNYNFQQHAYVGINNNETERKTKTVFLENPFDSALTRRVKKVYGTIDSFSIRLGVFFRRYPIARVFVIIYMLLLHLWVMIVLLTYEPEIHHSNHGMT